MCKTPKDKEDLNQTYLVIQWLGLGVFTVLALGSIPGRGTKITQAAWRGQKKKEK